MLMEGAYVRVPRHFSGFVFEHDELDVSISYALHPDSEDSPGGIVSVVVVQPGASLGYRDPARMAEFERSRDREVTGPVYFRYAGLEVTATVHPNLSKGHREGAHDLNALVDVKGQSVYISADSAALGVSDDAGPEEMAKAAIDLLRLETE